MSREQARGELGWDQNDPVVFFYAGSNPIGKGLDLANATVNFVRQKMPNLKLQILDGSVPSHLMPLYYNASDCLLMTSEHEGSPNVVKEAMSCNLPIIAVDVGDVRERLNGVLCSAITQRDSLMLGAELTKIIRLNRRSNGRDAIEKLDQRILAQQLVSIYQKLA